MRCPKCGFISFDDQSTCGKCSHSLAETAGQLRGTSIHVDSPAFLNPLFERAAGNPEINADAGGEAAEGEVALDLSAEGEIEAESEAEESAVSFEGLDVSDLVPEQEESASGLAMESGEAVDSEISQEDSVLELESEEEYELDLGGESFADEEEEAGKDAEGVVDLSVLMGGEEDASAEETEAVESLADGVEPDDEEDALGLNLDDEAEPAMEDLSLDDLSLEGYEEEDDEDSRGEPDDDEMGLSLEVEDEDKAADAPQAEEALGSGLTLEKDDN